MKQNVKQSMVTLSHDAFKMLTCFLIDIDYRD